MLSCQGAGTGKKWSRAVDRLPGWAEAGCTRRVCRSQAPLGGASMSSRPTAGHREGRPRLCSGVGGKRTGVNPKAARNMTSSD